MRFLKYLKYFMVEFLLLVVLLLTVMKRAILVLILWISADQIQEIVRFEVVVLVLMSWAPLVSVL